MGIAVAIKIAVVIADEEIKVKLGDSRHNPPRAVSRIIIGSTMVIHQAQAQQPRA